ncbi:MAG TPA: CocE/NonD family hydrolase [Candidatus Hydrogenedentes bacterium]|nr:CocE/NonD family hydrolase [Candidatus Hydrogenedentota bacterium]HOJ69709.1 CocE/NonD family hydrolase [Candidatus Hydrogenedentota bacterium]HOK90734.1 CocE/NonD family hydrolase [Candidatus Hydrogenedentota bacterium]
MRARTKTLHAFACLLLCLAGLPLWAQIPIGGPGTTAGRHHFEFVPMRDGTGLATDVHTPDTGDGPWPVIVVRSTYGRDFNFNRFVENGYAVVVQDLRGMGGSQGEPHVFHADGWRPDQQDGADTIAWVARQPFCNGKIATYGESALAMTQMLLAPVAPQVTCQHLRLVPSNYYFDVVYPGGVFRKNLVEGWLLLIGQSFIQDIYKGQPRYGEFWSWYNTIDRVEDINAPAMFVNGWYDIFLQGTINGFLAREERGGPKARGNNHLILTWATHNDVRSEDYHLRDNLDEVNLGDLRDRFFARWLKDDPHALDGVAKVYYYLMGDDADPAAPGNRWMRADHWPLPATTKPFYLLADGSLGPQPPSDTAWREVVFDPENPVPTVGGANLLPNLKAGPWDQRAVVAGRQDILRFASPPLASPFVAVGRVTVRLYVSSDAPDTDFTAKLLDIYPEGDGREILVTDNIRRVKTRDGFDRVAPPLNGLDDVVELEIDLWSIGWAFNRGHRVGLDIANSNYPRFEVNPNTGDDFPVPGKPMRKARNRVHMAPDRASVLLLPEVAPDALTPAAAQ